MICECVRPALHSYMYFYLLCYMLCVYIHNWQSFSDSLCPLLHDTCMIHMYMHISATLATINNVVFQKKEVIVILNDEIFTSYTI